MNFAWSTVALLVALLPGFLFFVGLYFPEKFTRDVAQRSALGQLAGSVLVSLAVHGLCYHVVQFFSYLTSGALPPVNLEFVLAAFQLAGAESIPLATLALNIEQNSGWILVYAAATSALGVGIGYAVGSRVAADKGFSFLAQHRWIYSLVVDHPTTFTFCYILTHIRENNRILLYRGVLSSFAVQADGRFSYIVLRKPERCYMILGEQEASVADAVHMIGESTGSHRAASVNVGAPLLVIEGEDIANVVFERRSYEASPRGTSILEDAAKQVLEQLVTEARKVSASEGTDATARPPSGKRRKRKR